MCRQKEKQKIDTTGHSCDNEERDIQKIRWLLVLSMRREDSDDEKSSTCIWIAFKKGKKQLGRIERLAYNVHQTVITIPESFTHTFHLQKSHTETRRDITSCLLRQPQAFLTSWGFQVSWLSFPFENINLKRYCDTPVNWDILFVIQKFQDGFNSLPTHNNSAQLVKHWDHSEGQIYKKETIKTIPWLEVQHLCRFPTAIFRHCPLVFCGTLSLKYKSASGNRFFLPARGRWDVILFDSTRLWTVSFNNVKQALRMRQNIEYVGNKQVSWKM